MFQTSSLAALSFLYLSGLLEYLEKFSWRDAGILAKFVRAAQRNLSQQRPADNPDELLQLATSLKERLEGTR